MFREFVVGKQRWNDARDQVARQAWLTAALVKRKGRLPSLASLMTKQERPQTVNEQRTMLHILSAQYGGAVRKGKRR